MELKEGVNLKAQNSFCSRTQQPATLLVPYGDLFIIILLKQNEI